MEYYIITTSETCEVFGTLTQTTIFDNYDEAIHKYQHLSIYYEHSLFNAKRNGNTFSATTRLYKRTGLFGDGYQDIQTDTFNTDPSSIEDSVFFNEDEKQEYEAFISHYGGKL